MPKLHPVCLLQQSGRGIGEGTTAPSWLVAKTNLSFIPLLFWCISAGYAIPVLLLADIQNCWCAGGQYEWLHGSCSIFTTTFVASVDCVQTGCLRLLITFFLLLSTPSKYQCSNNRYPCIYSKVDFPGLKNDLTWHLSCRDFLLRT